HRPELERSRDRSHRRARGHGARALPAHRVPDQEALSYLIHCLIHRPIERASSLMKTFKGRTAVITGAGSGFGLEASRIAAREGMRIVMADVQQDALDKAVAEIEALGAQVLACRLDVARASEVEAMGAATFERFGAPHFVFNNAGVAGGGLIWEQTLKDWEWIVGVNLMGVAHGVRVFTPMMIEAAKKDPSYEGHIVNTASMAGLVNMPNSGIYNVTKHGVVAMSESLYQDLALVTTQIHCS